MPRTPNQKLKLLYIKELLEKQSDEEHPITLADIQAHLSQQGISAERKSVYSDIEMLITYGMDIVKSRNGYYLASRLFELAELKSLVDSVQASKFITHKKSTSLISKIESLTSEGEAKQLQRQVYVSKRIKTANESIYYNIDRLHRAISQDKQITFKYFDYSLKLEKVYRHGGERYRLSPYTLIWDDEYYYLVAYDPKAERIKHYRVDKMTDIREEKNAREGRECFQAIDIASYSKKIFGMFSGTARNVTMEFKNSLANAVIDRLGKELIFVPQGDDGFSVTAEVVVSPQFFAWLCGFGDEAKITAPPDIIDEMREHIRKIYEMY